MTQKGPQAPKAPPQTDTAAWMRMLATARGADLITKDGNAAIDARPRTKRRLHTLLPVANELYYEHAYPIARNESLQIATIVAHCRDHISTKDLKLPRKHFFKSRLADLWTLGVCETAAGKLLVPHSLAALRLLPPEVIGIQLIPQRSAWRLLRNMFNHELSKENRRLKNLYNDKMNKEIRFGNIDPSKFQRLHWIQFVNAVLDRAPPLIRAFPAPWTAADATDVLLKALLALVKLWHGHSLDKLMGELSEGERNWLVAEYSCLSQLLDTGTWKPSCSIGRRREEYLDFLGHLQGDAHFNGLAAFELVKLEPATNCRLEADTLAAPELIEHGFGGLATGRKATSPGLTKDWQKSRGLKLVGSKTRREYKDPPQADTVAWARMLAAARGADMIQTDGSREIEKHPLTMKRLSMLLSVANDLYEHVVFPTAKAESAMTDTILEHCQEFNDVLDALCHELDMELPEPVDGPWNKTRCEHEAQLNLCFPIPLRIMRPAPPEVIGYHQIPQCSAWRYLRIAIHRSFDDSERTLKRYYGDRLYERNRAGIQNKSLMQKLRNARLVDAVSSRAPPLIRALPARWTSPTRTDELLEALQALLRMEHARPLGKLVNSLSTDEYQVLLDEHACLSQLLSKGSWRPPCSKGRNVSEYMAFVGFLRQHHGTGKTKRVKLVAPPKQSKLGRPRLGVGPLLSAAAPSSAHCSPVTSAKRQRPDEASQVITSFKTGEPVLSVDPSESVTGAAAKRQRLDFSREARESLDVDVPLRMELAEKCDDEMLQEFNMHFPAGSAANDPVDWLRVLGQLPDEPSASLEQLWALKRPHDADRGFPKTETFPMSGGAAMLERSSAGFLSRSCSAAGFALTATGAVAALGLVLLLLALVFRLRSGRISLGRSRTHTLPAELL